MSALEALTTALLLGTSRSQAVPALDEGGLHVPSHDATPRRRLLDRAAVAVLEASAAKKPRTGVVLPPPCGADERPAVSARASEVLAELVENGPRDLLEEWLVACARAGLRLPHVALPYLLEAAAADKTLARLVAPVLDVRGAWLAQRSPKWAKIASGVRAEAEAPRTRFETGTRDERIEALASLRVTAPAEARELLTSVWKAEAADDRARFLALFSVGLAPDDEPFLEAALDDRSRQVREVAAELLASLPTSALVARMIERVRGLVRAEPSGKISVVLPASFEPAWARDGVREKEGSFADVLTRGHRQRWLAQLVSLVPLSQWTGLLGRPARAILEAIDPEHRDLVLDAMLVAGQRHPDPAWAGRLVAARPTSPHAADLTVLRAIAPDERAPVLGVLLNVAPVERVELGRLVDAWAPLDAALSRRMLPALLDGPRGRWAPDLPGLSVAHRLHPSVFPELEAGLASIAVEPALARKVDTALRALHLRKTILAELRP